MLKPFWVHQPTSVVQASQLLREFGEEAAVYCGGTELLLAMKGGFLHYRHLVDIKNIPGLNGIQFDSSRNELILGAIVTHREIERSPLIQLHLPILVEMERRVANIRVRSQGTIGGNLCFAEPHSDPATLLLALQASVVIAGEQERAVPVDDFFVDAYTTSLQQGELLTAIRIPLMPERWGLAYQKFGIHERPTLGVASILSLENDGSLADIRLTVGCVNPRATRLIKAEAVLRGAKGTDFSARLTEAARIASGEVDPVDDLHGSAEYKRHMVGVFVRRVTMAAYAQAGGRA